MAENTHTFEQGEKFNGRQPDETILIREVRKHTVVWDYIVNGGKLGRNTIEKKTARKFIKSGHWKVPLLE